MAKAKRNLAGAAVAVVVALHAGPAAAADEQTLRAIVLHVENYARISATVLAQAEQEATAIYAAAGIRTIWIDDESKAKGTDASALHIHVRLLSNEMSDRKIKADHVADNVMGQALKGTGIAYIFSGRIRELASRKDHFISDVFGKVLAHEVGHLLLSSGHSDRGIMMANLDLGHATPSFTDAQASDIRAKLAAETSAN